MRALTVAAVCEGISQALATDNIPSSVGLAISHTKYLFRHRDTFPKPNIRFWAVVDGKDKTDPRFQQDAHWKKAYHMYLNDPRYSPYTISHSLASMSLFFCLHPDYLRPDPSIIMDDWMAWLVENGISAIPRPSTKSGGTQASKAFKSFAKHATDETLCKVILIGWDIYKQDLSIIRNLLKSRFDQRVLPTKRLQLLAKEMDVPFAWNCFLDIKDIDLDEAKYYPLNQFGLITRGSGLFYIELLRYHRAKSGLDDHPGKPLLRSLYTSVQSCSDDYKMIRLVGLQVLDVPSRI